MDAYRNANGERIEPEIERPGRSKPTAVAADFS
jgi:hypothetical protein